MTAFIRADAWGLQTSSDYWPLVTQMAVWEDGPGWDTSTVVESAEIVGRSVAKNKAEFTVRYRTLGEIHADGDYRPVLDRSGAGVETKVFKLTKVKGRWKIVEPQDQPHLSVGFVLHRQIPDWCSRNGCPENPAQRFLLDQETRCAPSPIPINRTCSSRSTKTSH